HERMLPDPAILHKIIYGNQPRTQTHVSAQCALALSPDILSNLATLPAVILKNCLGVASSILAMIITMPSSNNLQYLFAHPAPPSGGYDVPLIPIRRPRKKARRAAAASDETTAKTHLHEVAGLHG